MNQKNVAILGATGMVGQKLIALLSKYQNEFKIQELVASEHRIGQTFGDVVDWKEPFSPLQKDVAQITLSAAEDIKSDYVLSCLPTNIADSMEPMLAEKGKIIFSNASSFRMKNNVPLLVPEINSNHLNLLSQQKTKGKIITNPNCSAVGVTLALAPLMEIGMIEHVSVVTLQSLSGAGYPGIPSFDLTGNTIPHIEGEHEKITAETKKILGKADAPAPFFVTTHVHRVPVLYGHTATLHVTFKQNVTIEQAHAQFNLWNEKYPHLFLYHSNKTKPQAARDLSHDDMRVHLGHLRQGDRANTIGLVALTHNLVRGAAGAVIANMKAYHSQTKNY